MPYLLIAVADRDNQDRRVFRATNQRPDLTNAIELAPDVYGQVLYSYPSSNSTCIVILETKEMDYQKLLRDRNWKYTKESALASVA